MLGTGSANSLVIRAREGIGVLVRKGLIDIELVEDLFSKRFTWIWENLIGPNLDYVRKLSDDPSKYNHMEYLYDLMKQREQQAAINT